MARFFTPTVLQMETAECGVACLAMILGYYGHYESLENLRDVCCPSRNGSKASVLLKSGRKFGLKSSGYQIPVNDIFKVKRPLIIFWNFEHYVVYEGCNKQHSEIYINDPAEGHRIVDLQTFEHSYTGIALAFEPGEDFVKNNSSVSFFQVISHTLNSVKSSLWQIVWAGTISVFLGIALPSCLLLFIDGVVISNESDWLNSLLIAFGITIVFTVIINIVMQILIGRTLLFLQFNRTINFFCMLFKVPSSFISKRNLGDLQHRLSLTSSVSCEFIQILNSVIIGLVSAIVFFVMMLCYDYRMAFLSLFLILLEFLLISSVASRRFELEQKVIDQRTKMLDAVISSVDNLESMKITGNENYLFNYLSGNLSSYNMRMTSSDLFSMFYTQIPNLVGYIRNTIIFGFGASLVISGDITLGMLCAFLVVAQCFASPCIYFVNGYNRLNFLKAQLVRITEVEQYPHSDIFAKTSYNLADKKSTSVTMELRNVSFAYGLMEDEVVKDVSLTIKPGQKIALVGASGSGKSTLAKILAGLIKPTKGSVLVNGREINTYCAEDFYSLVGMVEQSSKLFSGSVGDNISMFSPVINSISFKNSLQDACIENDLLQRGNPLNIPVAEGGSNFSGGQCQRLEIARMLVRNTPFLIMDEATSALDMLAEQKIDLAITKHQKSILIIAHRLRTIRNADEILVMDHGKIIERGNFDELMKLGGHFAKLMQLEEVVPS